MSIQDAKDFRSLLDSTDSLKEEVEIIVRAGTDITPELLVEIGAKNNLSFSPEEIRSAYEDEQDDQQLGSTELSGVAGGRRGYSSWQQATSYKGSFKGRGGRISFSWANKNKGTVMLQSSHHEPV